MQPNSSNPLVITFENTLTGPLSHRATAEALQRAVDSTETLYDAGQRISAIPCLAIYLGDHHVAVHPSYRGQFANGSQRVAIVTEAAAA